jgi:serine phosphatase RsbU (regulator of sigma subunit)
VRSQAEVLAKANAELKKLREEEHSYLQAIKRELELGRKIQMGFLPHTLPQVSGWEIAAAFEPAREVSGDFYDAFMLGDDQVALVIADVSGKDVSAALFMSLIRTLIRVFAERAKENGDDPLDAIKVVNDYILRHHFPGDSQGSMFATIVFGILRPDSGEFRYINAGHIAPMIINKNGEISSLAPTGMAVGLAAQSSFEQDRISINPGDLFFLYTDGVTEAKNPQGDFFTKERLRKLLQKEYATARDKVEMISATLTNHNGGAAPYDDITMLAVKRTL